MPLYIPWLTETIKKRGVRYLLHHYLGQFFEEKLTLEQLSIDIYEGRGSIKDLALDVDGLNDELDFVPFRFLDGCSIGQISVEVPWSSLATEACRVELDGARFVCRLKTSADAAKTNCTESTLLSRSLMTSSMQMAEEIVTTEDDDDYDSPESSIFRNNLEADPQSIQSTDTQNKKRNANQMFEGLEMFAQLIDSVLRRTKLTARNTLFQIQPHKSCSDSDTESEETDEDDQSKSSNDEFSEPIARSDTDSDNGVESEEKKQSKNTVEFFIKFFRCEEIVDHTSTNDVQDGDQLNEHGASNLRGTLPTAVTKLLTLEDVEMRIGGIPVSNLIGKHKITIKFSGQKSEISIFSGSPLLAVISHKQLETFFNVFDSAKEKDLESPDSPGDKDQKMMSPEDYAKIENQLLESASIGDASTRQSQHNFSDSTSIFSSGPCMPSHGIGSFNGRRWVETGSISGDPNHIAPSHASFSRSRHGDGSEYDIEGEYLPSNTSLPSDSKGKDSPNDHRRNLASSSRLSNEPTLDNIEAFSCELKLPGIWLCILRDGEKLPPLIGPYADSINSFQSIDKYIDEHIKVPHIRCLALKVSLDITAITGTNIFLGDLDISEYLMGDDTRVNPVMKLLHNDMSSNIPMNISRYKASVNNGRDITIEMLTSTRMLLDPTIIDRMVYDYKLIKVKGENDFLGDPSANDSDCEESVNANELGQVRRKSSSNDTLRLPSKKQLCRASSSVASRSTTLQRSTSAIDISLNIKGDQFKIELLCPIPDLTPEAELKPTQLRPQSFIFDFKDILLSWQSDKLNVSSSELSAYVKMQPNQKDSEAVRFIESTGKGNDRITLILEPSPSNLDNAFTSDIERALNESTLYDSIYVSQATESRIPTSPFQTKRKVVRANLQADGHNKKQTGGDCDHEKILSPGDREHLLDYLNQTLMTTKLSIQIHLPICEAEFEDKEQLDLIYNRFGNDFVFWQPKALYHNRSQCLSVNEGANIRPNRSKMPQKTLHRKRTDSSSLDCNFKTSRYHLDESDHLASGSDNQEFYDNESETSYHSMNYRANPVAKGSISPSGSHCYDNQMTCKILVDELYVRFNHQSCVAAMKQDISADNILVGIVIDVENKPNTLLSLVADSLDLSNDCMSTNVIEGNQFTEKNSVFALTAEIKRPTKTLKDIKLAIQLRDALFKDFNFETYSRFWQSINVTDEPILGYQAPQIITEVHVDILNTSLMLVKDGARPSIVSMDELYLTSMVMQQTSQVMIRLIADEVSLYMKRDKKGPEVMKNYICLIDSGLIDLDIKFSQNGPLEFGVINNVITVRVCQDSLTALCKLFNVLIRSSSSQKTTMNVDYDDKGEGNMNPSEDAQSRKSFNQFNDIDVDDDDAQSVDLRQERHLLEDAMNDYAGYSSIKSHNSSEDDYAGSESSDAPGNGAPPALHQVADVASEYESDDDQHDTNSHSNNNTCLLDESNPILGDLFTQPLVPTNLTAGDDNDGSTEPKCAGSQQQAMDESGFFVIGDDDVGAGIIDKNQQHEPVVRKLIDGPINIIENYFKMTKPRTLPEMLANSLERYVLDEMTLMINLFGGRDFDDQDDSDEDVGRKEETAECSKDSRGEAAVSVPIEATEDGCQAKAAGLVSPSNVTSELDDAVESMGNHHNSLLASAIRSRAGSMAPSIMIKHQLRYQGDSSGSGSLKRRSRRKHLSEGSGPGGSGSKLEAALEQRVRFGEGAVNLWESLDLMSSPDFLGATRPRPNHPLLSSESKQAGGTWRQNDVCIQLILNKVKLLFEVADANSTITPTADAVNSALPSNSSPTGANTAARGPKVASNKVQTRAPISWRFMLFVQDIEVKDRIAASDINKMLYEYCTESMPRRSTQFLTIKNIATINQSDGCEECDLHVSLKPVRLNIDQDTLLFLIDFFTTFSKSLAKQQSVYTSGSPTAAAAAAAATTSTTNVPNNSANSSGESAAAPSNSTTVVIKRANAGGSARGGTASQTVKVGNTASTTTNVKLIDVCAGQNKEGNPTGTSSGTASHGYKQLDGRRRRHDHQSNGSTTSIDSSSSTSRTSSNVSTSSHSSSSSPATTASSSSSFTSDSSLSAASNGCQNSNTRKAQSSANGHRTATSGCSTGQHIATEELSERIGSSCSVSLATSGNPGGPSDYVQQQQPRPSESSTINHHHAAGTEGNQQPIYIKSFTFSPDVPIRIDYHAKHLDFEQGALAGILLGLAHLDHSELVLRRVLAKHGMRGLDRVLLFALNSWLSDIKRNQLPSILSGVGPMHSVIQLFQGMRDLIWMPIDHYRKDGRLVRGLQRGASSFSSSTAMAAINLVNRFISIVQCTAQIAHDIVTPPSVSSLAMTSSAGLASSNSGRRRLRQGKVATKPIICGGSGGASAAAQSSLSSTASMRRFHHDHSTSASNGNRLGGGPGGAGPSSRAAANHHLLHPHDRLNQPRNFCEGVAVGFSILKEGFNDTARNVAVGMQAEDMRSAVGELVRQIPSTLLNPIISATEGAQSVLVGIRNQIAPDARREDQEKWKGRARGK